METAAAQGNDRFEFVQHLASDLSGGQIELPSFPDVVLRVRQALQDENSTTEQLVRIIGAEPVLAARLLNLANSAALRPSGDPITDLNMAVTRVGRVMVRSSAMSFALEQMKSARKLETVKERLNALWEQCAYVAALCHVLAKNFTRLNADEAMFVGLMHGLGRMYIIVRAEDFPNVFGNSEDFEALMDEWESGIGSSIIENWGFSAHISEAVRDYRDVARDHEGGADYTDVLILAYLLYRFVHAEGDAEFTLNDVPASQKLNIGAEDMIKILSESERQIVSLRQALGG
ncbi:MAG: HDOD domain-containing protein [Woeseiaceae bacterium]|nr:HDOD domain-containing protein [Woeseiaceae bacterium]